MRALLILLTLLLVVGTGCSDSAVPTDAGGDGAVEGGPSEGGPSEGGPSEGGPSEGGPSEGGPSEGGPSEGGVSECDPATDPDTMTRVYRVHTLRFPPNNTIGANIDGLSSTSPADVAGCRRLDGQPGGIDNAVALVVTGLGGILEPVGVDLGAELQNVVTNGNLVVDVTLHHWNGTATDACVGVSFTGSSNGAPFSDIDGIGALTAGTLDATLSSALAVTPVLSFPADGGLGTCTEDCVDLPLPLVIRELRARLVFASGMSEIVVPATSPTNTSASTISGVVLFDGEAEDGAFRPGLEALISHIDPSLVTTINTLFASYLDLDYDVASGLEPCVSTGGNGVSANALSVGLMLAGDTP